MSEDDITKIHKREKASEAIRQFHGMLPNVESATRIKDEIDRMTGLAKMPGFLTDLRPTMGPPMPDVLQTIVNNPTNNPAKWTHERLGEYIYRFEERLDEDHEVGARLVSFGSEVTFHIEDMDFWGPDIITFHGVNSDGARVQLIQHVTQLSVLLVAMKKSGEKARRIGFLKEPSENASHDSPGVAEP